MNSLIWKLHVVWFTLLSVVVVVAVAVAVAVAVVLLLSEVQIICVYIYTYISRNLVVAVVLSFLM